MQSTERYEQSPTESPTSSPSAPHSDLVLRRRDRLSGVSGWLNICLGSSSRPTRPNHRSRLAAPILQSSLHAERQRVRAARVCMPNNDGRRSEGEGAYVKDDEDEQRCGGGNRRRRGRTRRRGSERALLGCFSPTWNLAAVGGITAASPLPSVRPSVRWRTCRKFRQKSITSHERTLCSVSASRKDALTP